MTIKRRCIDLGKNVGIIMLEDIVYIEQKGHTVYFHLSNGETVHKIDSLNALMKIINTSNFCCCHKSYAVNFDYVESIESEIFAFKMQNGEFAQIKQRDFVKIRNKFNDYMFYRLRNSKNEVNTDGQKQ